MFKQTIEIPVSRYEKLLAEEQAAKLLKACLLAGTGDTLFINAAELARLRQMFTESEGRA